jgi:SAM-dependent methyltransferase
MGHADTTVGAAGAHARRSGGCDYDAELRRHTEALRRALSLQATDRVLDIGCGTGQTTREAARVARAGNALGVDISMSAIERARELARAEGLSNIAFERADAQTHRLPRQAFDLAISRFGTMFFDDPVAAFANVGQALRPAGRLVMMVWQASERNEWDMEINQALGEYRGPMTAADQGPEPFSLADPRSVEQILQAAGFAAVTFTDVHEPVYYGPGLAAALHWVRGFTYVSNVLEQLDPADEAHAVRRLRQVLAAHMTDDGIWFDSRAWIVTARRQ